MRKHNRKMKANAINRAEQRYNGAKKMLALLSRGSNVQCNTQAMWILQQRKGI